MKFILIISLSFSCVHAALYQASARHSNNYQIGDQEVILQSIWEEIEIKIPESKRPLYKNYLSLNEEEKITQVEEEVIEVTPTEEKKKLKGLGGGKEKIAALLSKNREKLKQKQAQSKFDQVKIEEKGKKAEDNLRNWAKKSNKFIKGSSEKVDNAIRTWKDKYETTLKSWAQARENFLKRVDDYKESTIEIPIEKEKKVSRKKITKTITTKIPKTYHLIPGTLEIPIRDQGRRATCASFAGIRAVETVLAQNSIKKNLSEQYFYWASKPDCRQAPCRIRGSWVGYGLDYTKNNPIPEEDECPYKPVTKLDNETYTPLDSNCKSGEIYVDSYRMIETLDETLRELNENRPVIVGLKLKENFYDNKGAVFMSDKNANSLGKDSHAQGHAVLFVGYIQLPPELHSQEGKVCFLTANSWSTGWGRGGYACLSEKWIIKNRGQNPFVAVTSVDKR